MLNGPTRSRRGQQDTAYREAGPTETEHGANENRSVGTCPDSELDQGEFARFETYASANRVHLA